MIAFDPDNAIVKLCAEGINCEGDGTDQASALYHQAWELAATDAEKMIAAHYMARLENSPAGKLKWDQVALTAAQLSDDAQLKGALPSLYLNIAKCYEDLNDFKQAKANYLLADSFIGNLNDDGYGQFTRSAIQRGLERIENAEVD